MMKTNGIVAVLDGNPEAGSIAYWRLSGSLDLARLRAAWTERGLDPELLPQGATPMRALRRAMSDHAEKRKLVRPLEGTKGWALVEEQATGDDLTYVVPLRATVGAGDQVVVDPPDHPSADGLRAAYARQQGIVAQGDVGGWLSRLVYSQGDAVALRDTGGVYFVPKHALPRWRLVVDALHAASAHVVFGIPALPSADTVAAVIDAVTSEAVAECAALEGEVMTGELTERALETRRKRVEAVEVKLQRYEGLLGSRLEDVRRRIEDASSAIVTAALAAAAPKQQAMFP